MGQTTPNQRSGKNGYLLEKKSKRNSEPSRMSEKISYSKSSLKHALI